MLSVSSQYNTAISEAAGFSTELVTFIDIDEDGKLDFLIQRLGPNNQISLYLLYNNVYNDNFFIKAMMLNSKQEKSDNIYGDNTIGASYRFVITDLEDKKFIVVGSQNYQQAY